MISISSSASWHQIKTKDHKGVQELLTVRSDNKEQTYLYWMSPHSETKIQVHQKMEDVIIVQGSLYWLNENNSIQKKLVVGDAVDRKPNVKHMSFLELVPEGCLMYVRFHS